MPSTSENPFLVDLGAPISLLLRFSANFNQYLRASSGQSHILVTEPDNPFENLTGWLIGCVMKYE